MLLMQISIFVENRIGRVAEVARLLGENRCNIHAISLADTHDFGIIRLIVSESDRALAVLEENKYTVHTTQVAAVELPDFPGKLGEFLDDMSRERIDVNYIYGFSTGVGGKSILIMKFGNDEEALAIIKAKGHRLVSADELFARESD